MRIDNTNSALTNLRNAPKITISGQGETVENKSIGETPPLVLQMSELGTLAALFAPGGLVSKLKRRLNKLKRKKCRIVPAKGTIACVDSHDLVYLGVDFLAEYQEQEEVIAGVLAHEWGHACAERPAQNEVNELNWNQIFELRRAHEVLADEISGRLLALMHYKPDHLVKFVLSHEGATHNLKYHDPQTRAEIILHGYNDEMKKIRLAREVFPTGTYLNDYHSKLIDDDV